MIIARRNILPSLGGTSHPPLAPVSYTYIVVILQCFDACFQGRMPDWLPCGPEVLHFARPLLPFLCFPPLPFFPLPSLKPRVFFPSSLPFLKIRPPEREILGLGERCKLPSGACRRAEPHPVLCILVLKSGIWLLQLFFCSESGPPNVCSLVSLMAIPPLGLLAAASLV